MSASNIPSVFPNVRWYAYFEYCTKEGFKTAKYATKRGVGYYPPMETQKNRQGEYSLYLIPNKDVRDGVPPVRLEGQNTSLNLTGLHFLSEGRRVSRFAYGFPNPNKTYTSKQHKNVANPFYAYRNDGFLFILHGAAPIPTAIEVLVLEGAKPMITVYAQQLKNGGFDEVLTLLREEAHQNDVL